jgi:hypothetical protein
VGNPHKNAVAIENFEQRQEGKENHVTEENFEAKKIIVNNHKTECSIMY